MTFLVESGCLNLLLKELFSSSSKEASDTSEFLFLTLLVVLIFQFVSTLIFRTQNKHRASMKDMNTMCSLVHAVTSSIFIAATILMNWEVLTLSEDLIHSKVGTWVRIWSLGYFISDFIAMIQQNLLVKYFGLTLHHLATIITLGFAAYWQLYAPMHLLFLLAEFNSIFLHVRSLLHGFRIPSSSALSRVNLVLFWFTLVVFRLGVSVLIYYILYLYGEQFPQKWHFVSAVLGTTVITFANLYLVVQVAFSKRK